MPLKPRLGMMGLLLLTVGIAWGDQPTRGVWVASVGSEALFSREAIDELIDSAAEAGANTLYPVVWNRGVTLYPSKVMRQTFGLAADPRLHDFDPLAYLTHQAHARDMRVIAWFEFGFACAYGEPDGGPIIAAKPHWAAQDVEGRLVSKNNFQWMNSFHPEVQTFLLALVTEVVQNYPVDGVQGDDRLPACPSTAGYDPWTRAAYAREHHGADPPADPFDPAWVTWRSDRLSDFARRLYQQVKRVRPEVVVSVAPSIYPWSKQQYLQDWPTWVREGWVDQICPQVYRAELKPFCLELDKLLQQIPSEKRDRVATGILVSTADGYETSSDHVAEMLRANRERGFTSEVIFYHEGLTDHLEVFRQHWLPSADRP